MRRISGKNNSIIACYDSEGYYSNDNLMHLVRWNQKILEYQRPENKWDIDFDYRISLKYIASILNSTLIRYFFSKFLSTDTLQGSYSSIYPEDLRQIPIRKINENEQKFFILIVDKILELKKQNPTADTSALEAEIDEMVYRLYGLTDEEIQLVENS